MTGPDRPPGGPGEEPAGTAGPPLLSDGGLLALLVLDAVLLAVAGLAFAPAYVGALPAPFAALLTILLLPWLVRRASEIDTRPLLAAAPLSAWAVTVGVLGLAGPGGDVLLPSTWPTLLLLFGGLGAGMWALSRR